HAQLLDALTEMLNLDGAAVLANGPTDDGYQLPVQGLEQARVERLCSNFSSEIATVNTSGHSLCLRLNTSEDRPDGKGKAWLAIVPILAWGRAAGIILMICSTNKDLKDRELMDGIGVAAGVSLANLLQKDNLQDALSVLRGTLDSTADGILVVADG
ncbi:MAG: hypothetical protein AAB092_07805, partial [Chloroflexota bacterium]